MQLPSGALVLGERTLVMGVLNLTPDSFSDGGFFARPDVAVAQALALERAGADLLDIGGESTRPGSAGVTGEKELKRVMPVLERLRGRLKIPISMDTQKAEVAEAAIAAGAQVINDVSALRTDVRLGKVAARHGVPLVLMHMRGQPRTMQQGPFAKDVMGDVASGLRAAVERARNCGVQDGQIILDPGIGFGKSDQQNREVLARLDEFARLGYPLLVGTSRKAFIGKALSGDRMRPTPAHLRIWGTAATVAMAILRGAHIVRVHDVAEMAQVARVADAIARKAKSNRR